MNLRDATARDAPALVVLEATLFGDDAWSQVAVLEELEGAGRHAVVAVEGDEVVGYAVTRQAGEVADLQRIGVRADRRRAGIAGTLLEAVLGRARDDGANGMLLEVSALNTAALAFYTRSGFTEIDRRRRYYRDGSDAVVMAHAWPDAGTGGKG